jgi:peptidyl-prolyl cis-trans isomerase B (cyclophilin B)
VASTRTRQRKLERDRYERKLVRQAQRHRRKRQIQAGVGAFLALALIGVGTAWLAGAFESDTEPFTQPDLCTWIPRNPTDPNRVDVGTPPGNPATRGQHRISIDLATGAAGSGTVEVLMDVTPDPCGAANLEYLAGQGFYDGTTCHELAEGALRCGDPSGTGLGGPTYSFFADNLPLPPPEGAEADGEPLYPAGTVAFGDAAGENGSQFLIFYEDFDPPTPVFPIIGSVTGGLELVEAIGAAGVAEGTTAPAEEVVLESMTVTDAAAAPTR